MMISDDDDDDDNNDDDDDDKKLTSRSSFILGYSRLKKALVGGSGTWALNKYCPLV